MLSDDLRLSLRADHAPRRRINRYVLLGAAVGIAVGLALAPWAVDAASAAPRAEGVWAAPPAMSGPTPAPGRMPG